MIKAIPGALHLGRIDEPAVMAQAYSAADVFALPSIEDNLPNTMLESMCCGTPVVAFNSGGTAEIIRNGVNGLIAPAKTAESLRVALAQVTIVSGIVKRLATALGRRSSRVGRQRRI